MPWCENGRASYTVQTHLEWEQNSAFSIMRLCYPWHVSISWKLFIPHTHTHTHTPTHTHTHTHTQYKSQRLSDVVFISYIVVLICHSNPPSSQLGIYIAPLTKALYNVCLSFTHSHTKRQLAAMQGTNQLVRSNWGLGVLLRDTSTHPGQDRTGNPPTARRQLLPPEPYRPYTPYTQYFHRMVSRWEEGVSWC